MNMRSTCTTLVSVLAFLGNQPAVAADVLSVADVMVDFRALIGQRIEVACSVVPAGAELVYCKDQRLALLIDAASASRDDRVRIFQGCADPDDEGGCAAIITGVLTDWHGIPRISSPTISPVLD